VRHHGTARGPERASVPERAWHAARWRARDLARLAQFHWARLGRWETAGALWLLSGVLCLLLFLAMPMTAQDHRFCTVWSGLLCALGAATFTVARAARAWRGRGTRGGGR
jgi:hypothetical protein